MGVKFVIRDKDLGWKRMQKAIKNMEAQDFHVLVGVFGESGLGKIAGIHEYGAPGAGIPERSFIRANFDAKQRDYEAFFEKGAGLIIDGKVSPRQFLALVGFKVKRDTVKFLTGLSSPPNTAATIKAKGSSNPLIDTGALRNAIDSEVAK